MSETEGDENPLLISPIPKEHQPTPEAAIMHNTHNWQPKVLEPTPRPGILDQIGSTWRMLFAVFAAVGAIWSSGRVAGCAATREVSAAVAPLQAVVEDHAKHLAGHDAKLEGIAVEIAGLKRETHEIRQDLRVIFPNRLEPLPTPAAPRPTP